MRVRRERHRHAAIDRVRPTAEAQIGVADIDHLDSAGGRQRGHLHLQRGSGRVDRQRGHRDRGDVARAVPCLELHFGAGVEVRPRQRDDLIGVGRRRAGLRRAVGRRGIDRRQRRLWRQARRIVVDVQLQHVALVGGDQQIARRVEHQPGHADRARRLQADADLAQDRAGVGHLHDGAALIGPIP